jgi:hypothetical protein
MPTQLLSRMHSIGDWDSIYCDVYVATTTLVEMVLLNRCLNIYPSKISMPGTVGPDEKLPQIGLLVLWIGRLEKRRVLRVQLVFG